MKRITVLSALYGLLSSCLAFQVSASTTQLDAHERQEQMEIREVVDLAEDVIMGQKDFAGQTMLSCLRAFGHKQFCDCLSRELPKTQSFDSYVFFITTDKVDLNYDKLPSDDRQLIDNADRARETCVKGMGVK